MDFQTLNETPPFDWPKDTDKKILEALRDDQADHADRLLAADLAGCCVVVNDELAIALLSIVESPEEEERLRTQAAMSLGPILQYADEEGFDDLSNARITENAFQKIRQSLQRLYRSAENPKEVRRRILETSVRSQQDWHREAIRKLYLSDDEDWKLTAVFCMGWVAGFDDQIVEALACENPAIQREAVWAAGEWELDEAWPYVVRLVNAEDTEKSLLLAVISAVGSIRPQEAGVVLDHLIDDKDEEIRGAVSEAIAMGLEPLDDDEDDDELYAMLREADDRSD